MTTALLTTGNATKWDWLHEQGELDIRKIPVFDSTGALFDVTGWSVDAKIKTDQQDGDVLYTWSSDVIVVSGTYVYLTVPPATSLAWTFNREWYRVKVIHPTDATNVQRILQGKFLVSSD